MSVCAPRRTLARGHEVQVSQRYTMAMQLRQSALISKWHLRILKLGQLLAMAVAL